MAYQLLKNGTPRIRGVLFDMDGLVLDSEKLFCRFWVEAARSMGFDMTHQHALNMRGLSAQAGEAMLKRCIGPQADYAAIRAQRIRMMDAYVAEHGIDPKPGIFELLDYLDSAGIATAITSSSPPQRIRDYLSRHSLDTRFGRLCSGTLVPHGKPAPDIYRFGAASLGLDPGECLALEDAPAGITSAFWAGCRAVIIPDQDQPGEETLAMCFARADSLTDIIGLLQSLG